MVDRSVVRPMRVHHLAGRGTVLALAVGWLSLALAVASARADPATGYEFIYRATPLPFWIGLAVAGSIAVAVAVGTTDRWLRWVATTLGGAGAVAVVGLPLIRGYFFLASADSLSHLGWIRDLGSGRITPFDMIYPGIHSVAVMTSHQTALGYPRATMLAVLAVVVGFFLAVPAAVWALTGSDRAAAVGAFSAFMVLPINLIVTQPVVHPITQASFFVAVLVYLLARYATSTPPESRFSPTSLGIVLGLASVALVLYHPQAGLAMLAMVGAVAVVQFLARRLFDDGPVTGLRPLYAPTLVLGTVFLVWSSQQPGIISQAEVAIDTVVAFVTGEPTPVAGDVSQRGASLSELGSGLHEIFLKLFLVGTAYVALAGLLFLRSVLGGVPGVADDTEGVVRVLVVGLFALAGTTAVQFLGTLSGLVYRYVAIGMAVVTVLGAISLYWYAARIPRVTRSRSVLGPRLRGPDTGRRPVGTAVLAAALVVMLSLSVPAVFASPYVYQPSTHVSEMEFGGYETAFDDAAPGTEFVGIRGGTHRYRHAVRGTTDNTWSDESLPPDAINESLATSSPEDRYLVVTETDQRREVDAYRQLRYSREHFRTIRTQPGIDRVQSNGEFELFYDRGESDEEG